MRIRLGLMRIRLGGLFVLFSCKRYAIREWIGFGVKGLGWDVICFDFYFLVYALSS